MSETDLRRAGEVAAQLGVSPSTLRRWSKAFAEYLSDSAGLPDSSSTAESVHRRYTAEDVALLTRVKELLAEGLTYKEVAKRLKGTDVILSDIYALAPPEERLSPSLVVLTNTLGRIIEGQQTILNSQQANRNLLGVIIQDNFNLKEENVKLREQMLRLEQELHQIRKESWERRLSLEERIAHLERKRGLLDRLLGR